MSDDILDRARAALSGVTPGPWERVTAAPRMNGIPMYQVKPTGRPGAITAAIAGGENAEFIAAARMLVSEMADEIEQLRDELALYREDNEMRWRER